MRLLLVTQDFPPETGGIQSYMGHLARALRPLCEELVVVAPRSRREPDPATATLPAVRIGIHSSWLVLPLLARLPGLVERHRATHVLYAQWFPALAGLRLPREIVQGCIVHGRELLNHPLGSPGLALARPVLGSMRVVLPNSVHTSSLLPAGLDPSRVHVVHPGVDGDVFRPPSEADRAGLRARLGLEPGTKVVTCLTRLVRRKGVDTLLEAAALLRDRVPGVRVLVGGNGPDRPRLEERIRELSLSETVTLLGRIDDRDLPSFLSLGVFTLLSREEKRDVEGFGMVLAEAQSCGARVVAARSGGMPEAVGPGAGRLVAPDSPLEAAAAFEEMLATEHAIPSAEGMAFAATLDWPSRARLVHGLLTSPERS